MLGRFILAAASLSLAVVACGSDGSSTTGGGGGNGGSTVEGTSLPCDVAEIVERRCLNCHGNPLRSGAPWPLIELSAWRTPSIANPDLSNGELSVQRMQDPSFPMPPEGLLSAEEVAIVANWVGAGMPGGECAPGTPADGPLDAAPICNSMDFWPAPLHNAPGKTREEMFPGMPCIDCHTNPQSYGQNEGGPIFSIAGTVFPSAHEPDNCAGLDGTAVTDVVVQIVDASGTVHDLHPNRAGNFMIEDAIPMPYSAKVISSQGARGMSLKPTTGDCNLCHTENGSSGPDPNGPVAPGRIVVPAGP
ncbi:MAG: hypothetical protein R3B72_10915 [Polyangiaceae bacterium]